MYSQIPEQPLGCVMSVRGSKTTVGLLDPRPDTGDRPPLTVGNFVSIRTGNLTLIGIVIEVGLQERLAGRDQRCYATAQVDLMGEIAAQNGGSLRFTRGLRSYPGLGDPVMPMTAEELRLAYAAGDAATIDIGHLHQDSGVGAYVKVDDLLSKHFAVLGSTGVGKSSGVAVILREVMSARPDLRIFLIDPHGEYSHCFGDKAEILTQRNLRLPFWLFSFEEILNVLFGGRSGIHDEIDILTELIPLAKTAYSQQRTLRRELRHTGFTVDTPVPYRTADLIALIDDRMGKLENRSTWLQYHKLISRIETVRKDPRYGFMFDNANVGGDTTIQLLRQLFQLPPTDKRITILQLAGFPADAMDAVVSVVCRMAFDFGLWSDGTFPLLFVCEEAHHYGAADPALGFAPTRRAISRIAREGRKYQLFLGLVTQRPTALDPNILSQCNTLFVMRLMNDGDQALLRSAVSEAAADVSVFIPSLSTREVLAFGEGVALPARLVFRHLSEVLLPRREGHGDQGAAVGASDEFLTAVVEKWRGSLSSGASQLELGATSLHLEEAPGFSAGVDVLSAYRTPQFRSSS
jgi:DNA helicase HerA-like ATPase